MSSIPSGVLLDALRTRLLTVGTLPAQRRWQNVKDEQPNPAAPYVIDEFVSGRHAAGQLGPATGLTKANYLYQITLVYQTDVGLHVPLAVADAIAQAFRVTTLPCSGIGNDARVRSVSIGPPIPDAGDQTFRVPVSITIDLEY